MDTVFDSFLKKGKSKENRREKGGYTCVEKGVENVDNSL